MVINGQMDLIWLDAGMREQGILECAVFDGEVGQDYDFTLTVPKKYYAGLKDGYVYPRGAVEFGGKIVSCISRSDDGFVTFSGKTWFGMVGLQSARVFQWSSGHGNSLNVFLQNVFACVYGKIVPSTSYVMESTPTIPQEDGQPFVYLDILKSLFEQAGKLPVLSAQYSAAGVMSIKCETRNPLEYDQSDYTSDTVPVEVEKQFVLVKHVTIYKASNPSVVPKTATMNADGTWTVTSGDSPVSKNGFTERYIAIPVDDDTFANPDWDAIIESVQVKDAATIQNAYTLNPSVGDTVTGKDETTGITATAKVTSKSLHISDGVPIFTFDTAQGV